MCPYTAVCMCPHAAVYMCPHAAACMCFHTAVCVCMLHRQERGASSSPTSSEGGHTSAYVSIRQHTSAYVRIVRVCVGSSSPTSSEGGREGEEGKSQRATGRKRDIERERESERKSHLRKEGESAQMYRVVLYMCPPPSTCVGIPLCVSSYSAHARISQLIYIYISNIYIYILYMYVYIVYVCS
jgi:hypothetical protein